MVNLKQLTTKITSVALISSGLYQIWLSLRAIFFIYPRLDFHQPEAFLIQEGLIEKALLLYGTMVLNSLYGVALLFKPTKEVKIIHLLGGMIILIISFFFVVPTPFTTGPIQQFILKLARL